jgi:diketogulonate reductase-like aldo/keto reductase
MNRKELGKTGTFLPEVGMGTWNYHGGAGPLRRGLGAGALFLDTAESYGTEEVVREVLVGVRERVFVATKVSPKNFRYEDVRKSAEASLRRLGVEAIDLLQLHEANPAIPISETMGAMRDLVDTGIVKFVGVSNFSVEQLREAQKALGKYQIVSNQVRYNLIDRTIERELFPYCRENGITVIAYSPLARGLERIRDSDPKGILRQLEQETGRTLAQLAIHWCIRKPGVVAIPKGNTAEHIVENCSASGWDLSEAQEAMLDEGVAFRHRGRLDMLLRKYAPTGVRTIGLRLKKYLPRNLRQRLN